MNGMEKNNILGYYPIDPNLRICMNTNTRTNPC